eukprot:464074-Pelagomonas_calceolata.AAC.1
MALPLNSLSVHRAPFSVPRYLHLDLGKFKLKNIARFCSHAHSLKTETSMWQEHTSECDKCDQGGLQDKCHKQTSETYRFISDLMDIFCVAGTIEQAEQPNYLAEGQIPL